MASAFLSKRQSVGGNTVTSIAGDCVTLQLKSETGKELVVRPATREDLALIPNLIKTVHVSASLLDAARNTPVSRVGKGLSLGGGGGIVSGYESPEKDFGSIVGKPYFLVAIIGGDMVGVIAGFPPGEIAHERDVDDWRKLVEWKNPDKFKDPSFVVFDPIAVKLGYGRKGVGEALMRTLLNNCAKAQVKEVHAETLWKPIENTALTGLLEKLGFELSGTSKMDLDAHDKKGRIRFDSNVWSRKLS